MTNFERYKETLTTDEFVYAMILNCDSCPAREGCDLTGIKEGYECEEYLYEWCNKEAENG